MGQKTKTGEALIKSLEKQIEHGMPKDTVVKAYCADAEKYVEYQRYVYDPKKKEIRIQTID
jgi:hypothetical protein